MFYSTKYFGENGATKLNMLKKNTKSNEKSIIERLSNSNYSNISMISCYYGRTFLNRMFDQLPQKNCRTKVIISSIGNSYDKFEAIISDLLEVEVHQTQKIFLYVSNESSILHTKLYIAYNRKTKADSICCLAGSANLSDNAFSSNEEILVDVSNKLDKEKAIKYFRNIEKKSFCISDYRKEYKKQKSDLDKKNLIATIIKKMTRRKSIKKDSEKVIDFFNSGYLAFKAVKNFSIGFSNCKQWKNLVKGLGTELPSVKSNQTIDVADILGVKNLDYNDTEHEKKFSIKNFSVETCFGYWVPRGHFLEDVKAVVFPEKENTKRESNYKRIWTALKDNEKKFTDNACKKIDKLFDQLKVEKTKNIKDGQKKLRIEKKIDLAKGTIQQEMIKHIGKKKNFYEKYKKDYISRGFFLTPMPYIWDDSASVTYFLESFSSGRSFNQNTKGVLHALNQVLDPDVDRENLYDSLNKDWNVIDQKEYERRKKKNKKERQSKEF